MMGNASVEEEEDWLRGDSPSLSTEVLPDVGAKKRHRKVLTLDDLLEADHKEAVRKLKSKVKSNKLLRKQKVTSQLYRSSDDEGESEGDLRRPKPQDLLDNLEKQVAAGGGEEVERQWGAAVFAAQLEFPSLTCGGAPSLQQALQASKEEGRETSLEELARSGFLRAWALCSNRFDESTLRWAYHQMAYSTDDSVQKATCKFLCDFVSQIGAPEAPFWLPTLADVKQTLLLYGYKDSSNETLTLALNMDPSSEKSSIKYRPPKNLRSLLEFISTCFVTRNVQPYYSVADIESLLVTMVHITLERGLLEILDKVQDCILALIRYLIPEEWEQVCPRVAEGISRLIQGAHNGVFLLGVLSGLGKRSVDLQHRLALHELTKLARRKKLLGAIAREVAGLFEGVDLKAKVVDFEKLYYQVLIADTFLWCNDGLNDEIGRLTWLSFLGLCSRRIYIGDERPFATKLRNTASFLVQKYDHELHDREDSPARSVEED